MVNTPRFLYNFILSKAKKNKKVNMKLIIHFVVLMFAVALMVDHSSAIGLLKGLGLFGNPMLGGAPATCGCNCGCGSPLLNLGLASRLALSKIPSLGLGCPTSCCLSYTKPCLATKLLLLKKKLLEKKMSLCGCGCGSPLGGCSLGCGLM